MPKTPDAPVKTPVKTPTPTKEPSKSPKPDWNPDRRLEPGKICPAQKTRITRRIERELP